MPFYINNIDGLPDSCYNEIVNRLLTIFCTDSPFSRE